jgi:hypothetical protein
VRYEIACVNRGLWWNWAMHITYNGRWTKIMDEHVWEGERAKDDGRTNHGNERTTEILTAG